MMLTKAEEPRKTSGLETKLAATSTGRFGKSKGA